MHILAVETSTLTGSVALLHDQEVVGEVTLSVSVQHSERLMPAIDRLLQDAGIDSSSIDLFAVSKGPGSFTGLRIGVAAVQGLSRAHGKPMIGVSTLEALAMNGLFFPGLIVPVLDAFRGEVYLGVYRVAGGRLYSLGEEKVGGIAELIAVIQKQEAAPLLFLGSGVESGQEALGAAFGVERSFFAPGPFCYPRASHVAHLAGQLWSQGVEGGPVLPNYLRRPG